MKAFLIGAGGDVALQVINHYTTKGIEWGLDTYFNQHGPIESAFIASGMVVGFEAIYLALFGQKNAVKLFVLGALTDIIFRSVMPMPSLKDYYKKNHPIMTMFWAGFPATWLAL